MAVCPMAGSEAHGCRGKLSTEPLWVLVCTLSAALSKQAIFSQAWSHILLAMFIGLRANEA